MRGCGSSSLIALVPSPSPQPRRSSSCATTTPPATRTGSLTMVGDSLNVGVEPYLEEQLPGWRIETDDVVGRGSDDGIAALAGIGSELGSVVVVSLGTNDPQEDPAGVPRGRARAALARRPWTLRRVGHHLAGRRQRRLQRGARRRGPREPCAAARRMARDGRRSTPSGSSATACTGHPRATPHAPRRPPAWPETACRRPPQ